MVKFTEDGFIIEVKSGCFPPEIYVDTMNEIVSLLQAEDEELRSDKYNLLELLKAMLPTFEQAKAMVAN